MDINKVQLLGNVGKDPEIKETKHKSKMAKFSIATTDFGKGDDGKKVERTSWHNIIAFNRQAETCAQYLSKGSQVAVNGSINTGQYKSQSGETHYTSDVVANNVEFIGSRNEQPNDPDFPITEDYDPNDTDSCPF